jgi:hypothetical protein
MQQRHILNITHLSDGPLHVVCIPVLDKACVILQNISTGYIHSIATHVVLDATSFVSSKRCVF